MSTFHPIAKSSLVNLLPCRQVWYRFHRGVPNGAFERQLKFLLVAASKSNKKIDNLATHTLGWRVFDEFPEAGQFNGHLRSLRHLSIHLEPVYWEYRGEEDSKGRKSLREAICTPDNLETLQVRGGSFDSRDNLIRLVDIIDNPHTHQFRRCPRLRDLLFEGIKVKHDHLLGFLSAHAKTLRILQLYEIEIEGDEQLGAAPSFIPLFQAMQENLSLDTIKLGGSFNNNADENWILFDRLPCCHKGGFHTSCFKGAIENFVVNGGDYAFDGEPFKGEEEDESWINRALHRGD